MGEDIYDLAPEEPKKARVRIDPNVGAPRPCPECGYDMRGVLSGRCPECGTGVTPSRLERAARRKERKATETEWFGPLALLVGGVAVSALVYGLQGAGFGGLTGAVGILALLGIKLAVFIAAGWIVFFGLSLWWFGFGHSLPITVLQVSAVYAGAEAVGALAGWLIPLPVIPWGVSVLALMGLLCKVLELDYQEAVAVAMLSWLLKVVVVYAIAFAFFA